MTAVSNGVVKCKVMGARTEAHDLSVVASMGHSAVLSVALPSRSFLTLRGAGRLVPVSYSMCQFVQPLVAAHVLANDGNTERAALPL